MIANFFKIIVLFLPRLAINEVLLNSNATRERVNNFANTT